MHEEDVFHQALERSDPGDRAAYLDQACAGDPVLRAAVEALLRANEGASSFLGQPVPSLGPTVDDPPLGEGPGTVIGPYKLLEQIGEGGFGVVFLAEQSQPMRRRVALKVLKPGMDSKQVVARFEAERQALALMDHPNIACVLDGGVTPTGRPYFVMELVKGVPITTFCDEHKLTPRQRLELFVSVCQAVQHAHQKGIIHRDLKPSNVLVSRHDTRPVVKVIDFGVAKALGQELTDKTLFTGIAQMIGTPLYMSPEQAGMSDLDIDTRSDVYSLGVLLYELLTGSTPFTRERFRQAAYDEIRRIIREEDPPKPSTRLSDLSDTLSAVSAQRQTDAAQLSRLVRGELDWIVMKALEKDRSRRYDTATAFAQDVQRYLADEPVLACPPSQAYRLRKFLRRNKGPAVAVGLVGLALVAGVIGTTIGMLRASAAEGRARQNEARAVTEAEVAGEVGRFWEETVGMASPWRQGDPHLPVRVLLEDAARQIGGKFADRPLIEAAFRHTLGRAFTGLMEHDQAVEQLRRAVELRQRELGDDDPATLEALASLGTALANTTRREEAEATLRAVHDRLRQAHGDLDKRTVLALTHLAEFFLRTNQPKQAEPLLTMAVGRAEQLTGGDGVEFVPVFQVAGEFYRDQGEFGKARQMLDRALAQTRRARGDGHRDTLEARAGLLRLAIFQGKFAELEAEARDLLAAATKHLGPQHSTTIDLAMSLADVYARLGKFPEAEGVTETNYGNCRRYLGDVHRSTQTVRRQLAGVYAQRGRLAEAERLLGQVLAWQDVTLGVTNVQTLETRNTLGAVLLAQKKFAEAEPLYVRLEAGLREQQGEGHHNTLLALQNVAMALDGQAKLEAAERRWLEVLDRCRRFKDQGAFLYDAALSSLGRNRLNQGKPADAEAPLRECVELRKKAAPDGWRRFNAESLLGGSLLGQKKHAEAEPLLLSGYEGMKAREKTIDYLWRHLLLDAADRLAKLYEATGAKDKAARWRDEREAVRRNLPK